VRHVEVIDSCPPKQAVAHGALDTWIPSLESCLASAKKTCRAVDEGRRILDKRGVPNTLSPIWKWNMAVFEGELLLERVLG